LGAPGLTGVIEAVEARSSQARKPGKSGGVTGQRRSTLVHT
jgi:hypothetical protein